jgi:hypothetical protein
VDIAKVLFNNAAKGIGYNGMTTLFSLIVLKSLNPVNTFSIYVVLVKICTEIPVKLGDNATSYGNSHSEHVDQYESFVFQDIPKGDGEIIFEHKRGN